MRRIVIVAVLDVVVGVAAFFLLRPKNKPASKVTSETASTEVKKPTSRRKGRTAGQVKPQSKAELRAERKRRRKEDRARKREVRRRERERRRMLRRAGVKRGKGKRGSKGRSYVVRAIVSLGDDSYALVDGRRVGIGDVVMGRRVVGIEPDRIEIESFGKRSTVRVGESIMPLTYSTRKGRG